VLNLVGVGPDLATARERAYAAADVVRWPGMQFRTDIGAQS
jgi:phosphoribosylamine--glycine ligase